MNGINPIVVDVTTSFIIILSTFAGTAIVLIDTDSVTLITNVLNLSLKLCTEIDSLTILANPNMVDFVSLSDKLLLINLT